MVGLDDDHCAFTVTVDRTPISVDGELLAIAQGRTTYSAFAEPKTGPALSRRLLYNLHRREADVHADHVCGSPLPEDPNPPNKKIQPAPLPDKPPF